MALLNSAEPTDLEALDLLRHFRRALKAQHSPITFIDDDTKLNDVLEPVDALIDLFREANQALRKARKKPGKKAKHRSYSLSDYLPWHTVHEHGKSLWQKLLSAAIWSIDSTAKGNSALYAYLEDAIKFEDLLYGLEPFYRDHTLHSLWVYLIGVKLMGRRGDLWPIGQKLNWYLYNDVDEEENHELLVAWGKLYAKYINSKINERKEAIWCIMALCHDLGYSIAKLPKLNEHVENVLKHYHVSAMRRVGYALDIEHKYLADQFIDLASTDMRIVPGASDLEWVDTSGGGNTRDDGISTVQKWINTQLAKARDFPGDDLLFDRLADHIKTRPALKDDEEKTAVRLARSLNSSVLVKCYRDDSSYWRLSKALERREHGVLSAYLLFKTLGIFADTYVRGSAEEWGLEDGEVIYDIIRGDTLFAIAQHEFAFARISNLSSLADILILCDELEEFSRIGRQLLSREYRDTTANTSVQVLHNKPWPDWLTMRMVYEYVHPSYEEFAKFCIRKCRRMCQLFSPPSREKLDYERASERGKNIINRIEVEFKLVDPRDRTDTPPLEHLWFTMEAGGACRFEILRKVRKRRIGLECRDDKLYCLRPKGQPRPELDHELLLNEYLKKDKKETRSPKP